MKPTIKDLWKWSMPDTRYDWKRNRKPKLPAFAWPGGYPIEYVTKDNSVLCADCATRNYRLWTAQGETEDLSNEFFDSGQDWVFDTDVPVAWFIYREGPDMFCDECNAVIESAYGDPEDETS